MIDQYRDAGHYALIDPPEFNQYGGNVTPDFDIQLTSSLIDSEIFYTTDGSDPEGANGAPGESAIRLNAFDLANGESAAKLLIPTGAASEADWTQLGYNDASWTQVWPRSVTTMV